MIGKNTYFAGFCTAFWVLVAASAAAQPAQPGASEWQVGEKARARLISAVTGVGELQTMQVGLEVILEKGWKTYWRSPGAAGVPPQIDWAGSANLGTAELSYPAPRRFMYYEFETYGYDREVIYPITVAPQAIGDAMTLKADVALLVCDDVCVPHNMSLTMQLPAGPAGASGFANRLNQYVSLVPGDGSRAGLALEDAVLSGTDENPVLAFVFAAEEPFTIPDMLIEGPPFVMFSRPKVELTRDARRALLTVTAFDALGEVRDLELTSMPLTITLIDGSRAIEASVAPQFGDTASFNRADFGAAGAATGFSFAAILFLALVGGLILNLMPCVLPVLSIKLLSLVGHGGGDPKQVRLGFLATSAGIVAAFLVLAVVLAGLKGLGMAAGWGIQFQQPVFVITLVLVLALFAANMWGVFEIRLPGAVSDVAMVHSGGTSLRGQFFQGVFATVLATPCSAPFLGTAVGFALSRGSIDIIAVFVALGVGMALPFLVVALFPGLATRLPKPGAWMITLKKALALALVATAVWLLTVLGVQVSTVAALVVAGLTTLLLIAIAMRDAVAEKWARAVPMMVLLLAAAAYATPAVLPDSVTEQGTELRGRVEWVPFDRMAIPALVASGKTVFVDVTAEWCITCLVNKKRVLDTSVIAELMERDEIIAMKADWTKPDNDIADYLASFNRFGIPFNAIYGPAAPSGVTLPELLTVGSVMNGFAQAGTTLEVTEAPASESD